MKDLELEYNFTLEELWRYEDIYYQGMRYSRKYTKEEKDYIRNQIKDCLKYLKEIEKKAEYKGIFKLLK